MIAGVVLAAGAGERFGGRKQLASLGDRPLLSHAVDLAHHLVGPITRVVGTTHTFIPERPVGTGLGLSICHDLVDEAIRLYKEPAEYFYTRSLHVDPRYATPPGYVSEATQRMKMKSQVKIAAAPR